MSKTTIKALKKNDKFKFNENIYIVKQKYSNWKKDNEPYLLANNGEIFYHGELDIELIKITRK